jgi:hypothetical protein
MNAVYSPGMTTPKDITFLVRYNWETKAVHFASYTAEGWAQVSQGLAKTETLHRCGVLLTPIPEEASIEAIEHYNETDKLPAESITAAQVLSRFSMCRAFPVLGKGDGTLLQGFLGNRDDPKEATDYVTIVLPSGVKRSFSLTVKEIENTQVPLGRANVS